MKYDKFIDMFYNTHKNACKNWKEGKPVDVWKDENENICIKYTSGNWWHYKIKDNKVIWW